VLVTIDAAMDLNPLARLGRRLQGTAQTVNLGADIFLANAAGRYLGRICHYRECHPRVACPSAQLRPAAASERRSPDRDPEPSGRRRSAHRPVAAYRCALCRTGGHPCAPGREARRRASQELSPSERRAPRETDLEGQQNTPRRGYSAEIGGSPDTICSCRIAVGAVIADRPPHRSARAAFPHAAPTSSF
jgi:hypothetical protein